MPQIRRPTPGELRAARTKDRVIKVNASSAKAERDIEIQEILRYAKGFLGSGVIARNTISWAEFRAKYLCLFNKQMLASMDEAKIGEINFDYSQRFSMYDPIYILDLDTQDPKGMPYPGDTSGAKYKVHLVLPARLNRLDTVNKLGTEACQVAAECLANSRSTSNPFDTRLRDYSTKLGGLLGKASAESIKQQVARNAQLAKTVMKGESGQPQTPAPNNGATPKSSPATGGKSDRKSLDADWE